MNFLSRHVGHHGRFYLALLLGVAAFLATGKWASPLPETLAGDVFFLSYLVMSLGFAFILTGKDLEKRAAFEDEGLVIVVAITLATIAITVFGIFAALGRGALSTPLIFAASIAGAPLGWGMLHTLMAFHYANLHYHGDSGHANKLAFPGTETPGPWEFIYFSFVVGMTAQTSDVSVKGSSLRRTVTLHAVISFIFNTVLIAMAVNAVVAGAS